MIGGMRSYAEWCRQEGQEAKFIKHPVTWLRGAHWDDKLSVSDANGGSGWHNAKVGDIKVQDDGKRYEYAGPGVAGSGWIEIDE
jgi:hypothetical protein